MLPFHGNFPQICGRNNLTWEVSWEFEVCLQSVGIFMGIYPFYGRICRRAKLLHLNLWELFMGMSHFHGAFCGNPEDCSVFTVNSLKKEKSI